MSDYALVVGIETYEAECAPPVQGPGLNALRFARWVNGQGVPPENILLFHNKCNQWQDELEAAYQKAYQEVIDAKIVPRESPTRAAIEKAWRGELLQSEPDEPGTLWFYWSGHGVAFDEYREALLCSNLAYGDPDLFYVSEFTRSFLSDEYSRFTKQRVIIDACAEQVTYDDLKIKAVRDPMRFRVVLGGDQTVWHAVAKGQKAGVVQDGSRFTEVLLRELKRVGGWPENLQTFYQEISKALADEVKDDSLRPRLAIHSRYFEDGMEGGAGSDAPEIRKVLGVLMSCKIPREKYQSLYQRTIGGLSPDERMAEACTLTAMLRVLFDLHPEAELGGLSRALVEFLCRVLRQFPDKTQPLQQWMKSVPQAGRQQVENDLNAEKSDLVLAVMLMEAQSEDGFPAEVRACMTDVDCTRPVKQWPAAGEGVPSLTEFAELQAEVLRIMRDARSLAFEQDVGLAVQIYANPPLLALPYHALPFNPRSPKDYRVFSQVHSVVLCSRARLQRTDQNYDLDSWRAKLKCLKERKGSELLIRHAMGWNEDVQNEVAQVDGLLVIRDVVGFKRSEQDLLEGALLCGLPLISWRVEAPADWDDFENSLTAQFQRLASLRGATEFFRDLRKAQPWARKTALLWDDGEYERLRGLVGEEPFIE